MKMKFICIILFFVASFSMGLTQEINPENLSERERVYWDIGGQHIRSVGAYYTDLIIGDTKEKHGLWRFYDRRGTLTDEQHFFRDRIHGKQRTYHANKNLATESYFVFNVADSIYKEWGAEGQILVQGEYDMGSPDGEWFYFYNDGQLKSRNNISNDTVYLIDHYLNDSAHTQVVELGSGVIKSFYISGGLKENYTYSEGLKTGPFEERMANGIISVMGQFQYGLKDGKWNFYFPNGRIEKSINYYLDTLHGSYLVMNIDSTINTSGNYKYGKKHGAWLWYNRDEKVEMNGSFHEDLQHGEWRYYFSTGALSYIANFNKGKRDGQWTYYFNNGKLFKEGLYNSNLKQGLWTTNYENGNLLMIGAYEKGLEEGVWVNYWESGALKNEADFKKGQLNGLWRSYSPDANLLLSGNYKKGLKTGEWKTYDQKKNLLLIENYKVMKSDHKKSEIVIVGRSEAISALHGVFMAFSETDFALKSKGKYKNGAKNGTFIDYYPGGVVPTIVAQYKNGELDGLFQQFSRRGAIRHQIQYKNDLKDGSFLIFNESGKIIIRKQFSRGRELRD
tara:strand:+ start:8099 stop:9784 length:1686 start_codon:yes stop_codon:yes gene_type:complete